MPRRLKQSNLVSWPEFTSMVFSDILWYCLIAYMVVLNFFFFFPYKMISGTFKTRKNWITGTTVEVLDPPSNDVSSWVHQ